MKTVTAQEYVAAIAAEANGQPIPDREEILLLAGKSPAEFGLDALQFAKQAQINRIEQLLLLLIERTNPPAANIETPRQPHIGCCVHDWL